MILLLISVVVAPTIFLHRGDSEKTYHTATTKPAEKDIRRTSNWSYYFKLGKRSINPLYRVYRITRHLASIGFFKIIKKIPRLKPLKLRPKIIDIRTKIEGARTYIYIVYVAPRNIKIKYYLDVSGFRLKPIEEKIVTTGLFKVVRLVVDGMETSKCIPRRLIESGGQVNLTVWFEDRYGKPVDTKPAVFTMKPVILFIDVYGERWYVTESGIYHNKIPAHEGPVVISVVMTDKDTRVYPPW